MPAQREEAAFLLQVKLASSYGVHDIPAIEALLREWPMRDGHPVYQGRMMALLDRLQALQHSLRPPPRGLRNCLTTIYLAFTRKL